jgi:hypothetical protein
VQLRVLGKASEKKDRLCSTFRELLDESSQTTDGRVNVVVAQTRIKQCLELEQAHECRMLLLMLLLWTCSNDGHLPAAVIFRMLRLVSIDTASAERVRILSCISVWQWGN